MLNPDNGLKQKLIKVIDIVNLVRSITHPEWDGNESTKLTCPMGKRHDDGEDSSPSLSINPSTGEFNCFGCGWKGTSIIGYYTDVICNGNFKLALAKLHDKYIREIINVNTINTLNLSLLRKPNLLHKISATRGWTTDTIKRFRIGWDPDKKRTLIPIFNLEGYCIDVRYHDTLNRASLINGKRIPVLATKRSKTGDWFPLNPKYNPFLKDEIWLVEGEPDAILASQDGLNCVTITGGAGAWTALDHARLKILSGKQVVICLDNDKAGIEAARLLSERLAAVGLYSLKNFSLPQGKDISDYFLKYGGSAQQLRQYITGTPYLIKPQQRNIETIPLSETGRAEYIGKHIKTSIIISGKAESPQAVPALLKLTCRTDEFCGVCPCKHVGEAKYPVLANEPSILNWLYSKNFSTQVKEELQLPKTCKLIAEVEEWQNLESLTLIPSLSISSKENEGRYTTRRGYYIGHGIESNQNYDIVAIPAVHPQTKESVLLVEKATGTYDSISKFELSKDEVTHLKEIFNEDPITIIKDIAKSLAYNVTHIYGRPDLHTAVDLCFHSPCEFNFAGVRAPKGSMELLLIGDTRCGKGQVAEGLTKYFDVGTVVSGENASLMGLLGGAQKIGDGFQLSWGAFPINHGRLVIVDEFSGLNSDILGRLSRLRSEGIAEINKGGINTKTKANVRAIWIANPRKGRDISSFTNGISAIMDLVGTNEDVARFDLAVVVQKGEVDIETINKLHTDHTDTKYTRDDLRKVLLWTWSRREEHIIFTSATTNKILESATKLATIYSSTIPLIQGENARFKIAKLAAAIAARSFSTDDGIFIKVTERHAEIAEELFHRFYKKPSMGYAQYSLLDFKTGTLTEVSILDEFFKQWPKHIKKLLIEGLLSIDKFGVRELQDWCDVDALIAKKFAGKFVRCQAVKQLAGGLYTKKPAFTYYLRKMNKRLQ